MQNDGLTEAEALNLMYCIGVDGKRHFVVSWQNTTLCGVKVMFKNPNSDMLGKYVYSCYECDGIEADLDEYVR